MSVHVTAYFFQNDLDYDLDSDTYFSRQAKYRLLGYHSLYKLQFTAELRELRHLYLDHHVHRSLRHNWPQSWCMT